MTVYAPLDHRANDADLRKETCLAQLRAVRRKMVEVKKDSYVKYDIFVVR